MSTLQATSFYFQTTCMICAKIRDAAISVFHGIQLGRQLQANYQTAQYLVGTTEYKGLTASQISTILNTEVLKRG